MKKTVVLYGYLYERDGKWGFKVNNRELAYYALSTDKLDKKKANIAKANKSYEFDTILGSAYSGGKLYINFELDSHFEKGELIRVELLE